MSDESGVSGVTQDAITPVKPGGFKGFFATTVGKVVVIGGAIVILLTIVTVVAVIVLGAAGVGLFNQAVEQLPGSVVTTQTAAAGEVTATVAAVPDIQNSDVFTPRDPFQPVIIPASAKVADGTGAVSTDDENTLTLLEIIEENGTRKAVLRLGATTYTQAAGEQLGSTPWKVVTVGTTSVTMLYGDSQIVLTVGQGVQTK